MYICQLHPECGPLSIEDRAECPECRGRFETRLSRAMDTPADRLAEFDAIPEQVTIAFTDIHRWIEYAIGRPVWTHEMASPGALRAEIASGVPLTFDGVVAKLEPEKTIIVKL